MANFKPSLTRSLAPTEEMSVQCNGTLTDPRTGFPLQDLQVELYFVEPSDEPVPVQETASVPQQDKHENGTKTESHGRPYTKTQSERLLGSCISGAGGFFQIAWVRSEHVAQDQCLLRNCSSAFTRFRIFSSSSNGDPLHATKPSPWGNNPVRVVHLAIPM